MSPRERYQLNADVEFSAHTTNSLVLDFRKAAAHCGLLPKVFSQWVKSEMLPATNWTREELDETIHRLTSVGIDRSPGGRRAALPSLPNVHRVSKRNSLEITRYHYYRRGMKGRLRGEPGSPEFMRSLINKERQLASNEVAPAIRPKDERKSRAPDVDSPSIVAGVTTDHARLKTDSDAIRPSNALPGQLLTVDELVARYKGRVAEGTWRNHRSRGTGPPYLKIFREIFYPLESLIEWERQNMTWGDLRGANERS
jgi:hypothetical protein